MWALLFLFFLDAIERARFFERLFWEAEHILGKGHKTINEVRIIRKKLHSALGGDNEAEILFLAEEGIKRINEGLNEALSAGLLKKKLSEVEEKLHSLSKNQRDSSILNESKNYFFWAKKAEEKGHLLLSYKYAGKALELLSKEEEKERPPSAKKEEKKELSPKNIQESIQILTHIIEGMEKEGSPNISLLYRLKMMRFDALVALAEGDEEKAARIISEALRSVGR